MKKKNILLFSHNLDIGGAPLYLLRLFGEMSKYCNITIVSPVYGELVHEFKKVNINVKIFDFHDISRTDELREFVSKLKCELIFFNTILMHSVIRRLATLEVAFVWAIHESEVDVYKKNVQLSNESFDRCQRIVFAAHATELLYRSYINEGNKCVVIPNGIDLQEIEEFRRTHSHLEVLKIFGHHADDIIISNIGTICERKGQIDLVNAALYLLDSGLISCDKTFFYLIGYNEKYPYARKLRRLIEDSRHANNFKIIGETRGIYDYYELSSIFVCTSYIESFPLSILEEMAFQKPIVTTNAYGIKEQLIHGRDAIVYSPGDIDGLINGLLSLYGDSDACQRYTNNSKKRVYEEFGVTLMRKRYENMFSEL